MKLGYGRTPNVLRVTFSPDIAIDLPPGLISPELKSVNEFWSKEESRMGPQWYMFALIDPDVRRKIHKLWQLWYSLYKEKREEPDEIESLLTMVPRHPLQDLINQHVDFTNAPPGCKPMEEAK